MTIFKDISCQVSPLLRLAAAAIAKDPPLVQDPVCNRREEPRPISSPPNDEENDEKVSLALPASQALFEAFKEEAESKSQRGPTGIDADSLDLFVEKGDSFPLESLDLEFCADLDDKRLKNLLEAHRRRLKSLNVNGCDLLTPSLNEEIRDLTMPNMEVLVVGNTVQLFVSQIYNATDFESLRLMDTSGSEVSNSEDTEMESVERSIAFNSVDRSAILSISAESGVELMDTTVDLDGPHSSEGAAATAIYSPSASAAAGVLKKHFLTDSCPNLRALVCFGFPLEESDNVRELIPDILHRILEPLRLLIYLDLSYWEGIREGRFLRQLAPTLRTLILYNVPDLYNAVDTLCELTCLVNLDLSQGNRETGTYPRPVSTLHKLVINLPCLECLDITSTNLASQASGDDWPVKGVGLIKSDIAGLRGLTRPLKQLGLFNCDTASHFQDIPAGKVLGDANENQVLLSLETYISRVELIQSVLNETYQVYRYGSPREFRRALVLVLEAMRRYLADSSVQIAGSASLFYIIRGIHDPGFVLKRHIILALLNGMEEHFEETIMIRNCCLSLCQFDIPQDLLMDYERAARLLVRILQTHLGEHMTIRIVVYLLNSMACHVEGEQKVQVGNLGAIECILETIRKRQEDGTCDEVMEVAWSFLWNITDETPANCERFLKREGMTLFHKCFNSFSHRTKLLRNAMGLLGNIAEVQELRHHLMEYNYVNIFCKLLSNLSDGIEISYNSAGVLAHLCADGVDAWTIQELTRQEAMSQVVAATDKWTLTQRRYINYRSFGPIVRLLTLFDCPASQHWAVWALANLTTVDGVKYCPYIEREAAIPLLEAIVEHPDPSEMVKDLVRTILDNIGRWRRGEIHPRDDEDV